jgi:Ca2+-binding RTX toxin-like protein
MAWFTSFSTVRMDKPLFGDLQNDQLFQRASFARLSSGTIDILKGTNHTLFRGSFTFDATGRGEILGGTIGSVASAPGGVVAWTLTGTSSLNILDVLDRASHLDPVGDLGTNIGVNAYLLSGNDRIDDQSTGASWLMGHGGIDTLLGGAGSDTLDGGSSFDTMFGGAGSDTYIVDNVSDVVAEVVDSVDTGGVDKVISSVSYALPDSVENLTLTGLSNINGFGNSLGNTIIGNLANNDLRGRGGVDSLSGGLGDDTLEGGAGNDSLNGGVGSDTASFLHASKGLDLIVASGAQNTGVGNDTFTSIENLIGSQFDDTLTGNNAGNVLEGSRGNDLINGLGGNDTASYANAKAAVTVSLAAGGAQSTGTTEGTDTLQNIENLTGGTFNDSLTGDGNANILTGGLGTDTLIGGAGIDQFVFDNVSSTDQIGDFLVGTDKIVLDPTLLPIDPDGPGIVLPNEFYAAAGATTAQTGEQHLIYNTTTGDLYYDRDGGGAFAYFPVLIAKVYSSGTTPAALSATDIIAG